jgi:hypothetical protein
VAERHRFALLVSERLLGDDAKAGAAGAAGDVGEGGVCRKVGRLVAMGTADVELRDAGLRQPARQMPRRGVVVTRSSRHTPWAVACGGAEAGVAATDYRASTRRRQAGGSNFAFAPPRAPLEYRGEEERLAENR